MEYTLLEVLNDNNLIFNIKYDNIFKAIFLANESRDYLISLLHLLLDIPYDVLYKKLYIGNVEMVNNVKDKTSFSDFVCKVGDISIIIEMNNCYSKKIINKNYNYLFKQHTSKSYNGNNYGEKCKTILINIDNFDLMNKKELILESEVRFKLYNVCLYDNIKIIHINLEYLKYKYYNNIELNELEKMFLLFIEQRKNKLRENINKKEVEVIINMIDRLKFEEHNGIVTYDREEYEKMLREEIDEMRLEVEKDKKEVEKDKKEVEKNKKEVEKNKKEVEKNKKEVENSKKMLEQERILFAKKLKNYGASINEIINITKLSIEEVNML